jgi:hypothetical protein
MLKDYTYLTLRMQLNFINNSGLLILIIDNNRKRPYNKRVLEHEF